jgi:exosortase
MNAPTLNVTPAPDAGRPGSHFWLALGGPLAVLLWAYWPNLAEMAHAWSHNAQYSHGYLVPIFAGFLLWLRRGKLDFAALRPAWWGFAFLLAGIGLRAYGVYHYRVWIDHMSLLAFLAGLCVMIGGWTAWRWAWPSILFLFFMIPLPFSVATNLSGPLQSLATAASTFLLQMFGLPALAEGNIIRINDAKIGIVEACSGLKMLVVFFALSTGMVLVTKAPLFDKLVLVASSVLIALISNILRITITGVLHELVDGEAANVFFHDVAGWVMMPLALSLLWLELKVLSKLLIETPYAHRTPAHKRGTPAVLQSSRPRANRVPAARGQRRHAVPPSEPAALAQPPVEPETAPTPQHVSPQGATA